MDLILYKMTFKVFTHSMGMLTQLGKGTGMANSQLITQGTSQFPIHGLAVVMKYKLPTSGVAAHGEFYISRLLSHSWGIGKYLL